MFGPKRKRMLELMGGGNMDVSVTHKIEQALKKDVALLAYNKLAVELTRIAVESKTKPEDVVAVFKKIRKELVE